MVIWLVVSNKMFGVQQNVPDFRRFSLHDSGDYVCTLCNRLFTTGRGLSNHVELAHPEGTFRANGFACPCCPRLFAHQSAHTKHLERNHCLNSPAFTCPYCTCVFPGKPIIRMHMTKEHDINDMIFPVVCPLCVKIGRSGH